MSLAVLAASPMYYQVPLYQRLAADPAFDFTAIFMSSAGVRPHDAGYGQEIVWDTDLLGGYSSVFLRHADSTSNAARSQFTFHDFDVVQLLRRHRFDVLWLHGYNSLTHVLAALTQHRLGGAVMFREEQTLLHPRARWKRAAKRVSLDPLLGLGRGLYIGSENRAWFSAHGMSKDRLFFVPYVVDNDALRAAYADLQPRRLGLRHQFGLHADNPVILTVSRLIDKKQPLFLLDAFQRVRARLKCSLLVVGAGELEPEMRRFVQAHNIPDVVFAGFLNQSQIPRAYACADIFALASKENETWGLVVNEAMNFELPVVVTAKVGCAKDLVCHGQNGFVSSETDVDAFAHHLYLLTASSHLRKQFGAASRERIRPWNYELGVRGIHDAVADVVQTRRLRGTPEPGLSPVSGQGL